MRSGKVGLEIEVPEIVYDFLYFAASRLGLRVEDLATKLLEDNLYCLSSFMPRPNSEKWAEVMDYAMEPKLSYALGSLAAIFIDNIQNPRFMKMLETERRIMREGSP